MTPPVEAMVPPVDVQRLVVEFGQVRAVDDLDLAVSRDSAVALVGHNGAGKSTTMRVLGGVIPPTEGVVRIDGIDVSEDPVDAKRRLGYCPDVGGLIPRATPWEHLQLSATLRGMPSGWESRAHDLLSRFDLTAAADRVASTFSHGMGRRLSVLLAAFHEPPVLLLDEPFDGVDPLGVDATLDLIADAKSSGAAILVSTHLLHLAVQACSDAVILRDGRVVAAEPASTLVGDSGAEHYKTLLTESPA